MSARLEPMIAIPTQRVPTHQAATRVGAIRDTPALALLVQILMSALWKRMIATMYMEIVPIHPEVFSARAIQASAETV